MSVSKEKRRDVEFISMVPITAAEGSEQMMCMQRDACACFFFVLVAVPYLLPRSDICLAVRPAAIPGIVFTLN